MTFDNINNDIIYNDGILYEFSILINFLLHFQINNYATRAPSMRVLRLCNTHS